MKKFKLGVILVTSAILLSACTNGNKQTEDTNNLIKEDTFENVYSITLEEAEEAVAAVENQNVKKNNSQKINPDDNGSISICFRKPAKTKTLEEYVPDLANYDVYETPIEYVLTALGFKEDIFEEVKRVWNTMLENSGHNNGYVLLVDSFNEDNGIYSFCLSLNNEKKYATVIINTENLKVSGHVDDYYEVTDSLYYLEDQFVDRHMYSYLDGSKIDISSAIKTQLKNVSFELLDASGYGNGINTLIIPDNAFMRTSSGCIWGLTTPDDDISVRVEYNKNDSTIILQVFEDDRALEIF